MRKQLSQDENKGSVGTLARGLDILELFARNAPRLFRTAATARVIERLAADFAREIAQSTDPRRAPLDG